MFLFQHTDGIEKCYVEALSLGKTLYIVCLSMSKPIMNQFQPSLTEWFQAVGDVGDVEALRQEDNRSRERLEVLYQTIHLPYERPIMLPARELRDKSAAFQAILDKQGDELCAIRLVPTRPDLPKVRQRGLPLKECYQNWFLKQDVPFDEYDAYICPHSETLEWSITFVVADDMVFGEIIEGMHSQLTHGDTENPLYSFQYDFQTWQWSEDAPEARRQVERLLGLIRVSDETVQLVLKDTLQAEFTHGYLKGYFEATTWPGDQPNFIDYNRLLPKRIMSPVALQVSLDASMQIVSRGLPTSPGVVRGRVVVVTEETLAMVEVSPGSILVCDNTDIRYMPFMKQAAAFVTDRGSVLSHASIVARELKKPCIVGTKEATQVLKTGDEVEVDAERGIVTRV